MKIVFSAWNMRDVMSVCGTNVVKSNRDIGLNVDKRPGLWYLQFKCGWRDCVVTGGNGFALGIMRISYATNPEAEGFTFVLKPFKVDRRATRVAVDVTPSPTDPGMDLVRIEMLSETDEVLDVIDQENERIIPITYELIEKSVIDDSPDGHYVILDRKLLIQCLEGLKGCEKVIFNFGSTPLKPMMLRPYDVENLSDEAEIILCPIRPLSGGTGLERR